MKFLPEDRGGSKNRTEERISEKNGKSDFFLQKALLGYS
jgi:hypothetical protein